MENILATWNYFLRGKRKKKDVMIFQSKLSDNVNELHNLLQTRTYKHGEYSAFNVSDPKPRNVHKATAQDRLLHHLIYKELYPYFDQRFIYDSYSCRKNKGTHRALNRFQDFARRVSKNNTRTCYILKCDIKKFFANINHEILKKILARCIQDKDIIWLLNEIIDSFETKTYISYSVYVQSDKNSATAENVLLTGLPLGNLTSQLLVNIYMHEFDMFMKQELRIKYYLRYADDFAIFSDSKRYLEELLPKMEKFLNEKLKLKFHENKVYIKTYASGVDFLGWVHFPYHRQIRTTTKKKLLRI